MTTSSSGREPKYFIEKKKLAMEKSRREVLNECMKIIFFYFCAQPSLSTVAKQKKKKKQYGCYTIGGTLKGTHKVVP